MRRFADLDMISMLLLVIAGLNAGVSAVFDFDAIAELAGTGTASTVVYALVGLSAVYVLLDRMGWMPGREHA